MQMSDDREADAQLFRALAAEGRAELFDAVNIRASNEPIFDGWP